MIHTVLPPDVLTTRFVLGVIVKLVKEPVPLWFAQYLHLIFPVVVEKVNLSPLEE